MERDATENIYSHTLYQSGFPGVPGSEAGSPTIAAGTYTIAGPGGADIGPFNASVTLPAPLNWTNRDAVNDINRSQTLTLTWTGGGSDIVTMIGYSYQQVGGTDTSPIYEGATFVCYQNASAGSFGIPSSILSQLPQAVATSETAGGSLVVESYGPTNGGPFTAPLTAGGSIDRGSFTYSTGYSKTVSYQ